MNAHSQKFGKPNNQKSFLGTSKPNSLNR